MNIWIYILTLRAIHETAQKKIKNFKISLTFFVVYVRSLQTTPPWETRLAPVVLKEGYFNVAWVWPSSVWIGVLFTSSGASWEWRWDPGPEFLSLRSCIM